MTPERWAQIERVLDALLDSDPQDWSVTIAELCGSDVELLTEVESLVARHGAAERFLEVPPAHANLLEWSGIAAGARDDDSGDEHSASEGEKDPILGSTISHYRIESRLGGGGMGIVYRARDARLEREVALKFLPPHLGLDPKARGRFLVEARAAAALDHPNICNIHEIGQTRDGRLFIAMACYKGQVLKERIAGGPLAVEEAVTVATAIARGLYAAHARGVVHRDIKPANVMLTADGGVKLLDFGLAKLADVTLTQSGITPGTVAYMSPEQIRGRDADARSDLWSLGVVLYEMLSGERPFDGEHDAAMMHAILHDEPRPLDGLIPEAMSSLSATTQRLLAKDPLERYSSAAQLLAGLELLSPATEVALVIPAPGERAPDLSRCRAAATRNGDVHRGSVHGKRSWKRPVALAAVLMLAAVGGVAANRFATHPAEIRRIALLPLANLTGDPNLDYFVDGVHYALSSELSKIEALTVYSRQSVLRYRGSDLPLPDIARELRVDALLEGAVFKSGDSVRITVHLLRARPEQQMLAASHAGPLSHALVLHNVVAREIADSVHARLLPADAEERRAALPVVNPAAEKAFLAGLYHLERSLKGQLITGPAQVEVLRSAVHHFEEAIALDPRWSVPHARLSTAYRLISDHYTGDSSSEYNRRAKAAAIRGVQLDARDAEAHASLGSVLIFHERDWAGAEAAIRRSLELDPYARAMTAAVYMTAAGRHDEAIPLWRKAEARYPLSESLRLGAVRAYACAGLHGEAIALARELTERVTRSGRTRMPGDSAWMLNFLAYELSMNGDDAGAIAAAKALVARDTGVESLVALAFVYARAGRQDEARALAERLETDARSRGATWRPAHLYAALGDSQRALDMVEAAVRERPPGVLFRCDVAYRVLRDEPRMRALVRALEFPTLD